MASRNKSDARAADEAFQRDRERNLRMLLMRSTRSINRRVTAELQRLGFSDTRPGHAALLGNLEMTGNSVTEIADRAQLSKQAMARLAVELETLGYVTRRKDESDARALVVSFTPLGRRLIRATVQIVTEIEAELTGEIGARAFASLRSSLTVISEQHPDG
jgi:DNA-binding MarR family transcriptional regulator